MDSLSEEKMADGRVGLRCGRGGGRAGEDAVGVAVWASSSSSVVPSSSTDWKDEVEREGLCFDGEDMDGLSEDVCGREGRGGGGPLPFEPTDLREDVSDAAEVVRLSPKRSNEGACLGVGPPPMGEKRIMSDAPRSGEPSGVAVWRDSVGPRADADR